MKLPEFCTTLQLSEHWTGPVHLEHDKVFGYWIQYLLLQATPSYHPFHKTGEMGQVSQIQLEAQPIPSLQNLPNPWLICTCQGHVLMGMLKPFWQKIFCSMDYSCKLRVSLDQLFRHCSSIPAGNVNAHTHTCALHSSHKLFVVSRFPSTTFNSSVFISVDTFPLIHGAAWLHIKQRMDIFL